MKHQGTMAAAIAVLAALLVGALADARPPEGEDDVKRQLREMREELDTLKKQFELDRQSLRGRLGDLDGKLDRIERLLRRGGDPDRRSYYDPDRRFSIDPAPMRLGSIRLDNRLGVPAVVTIDGVPYTVPPLTARELRNRPAGGFTYEVTADGFGLSGPRRRTLPANETWTLTIY